jgi:hypothetical protein
MTEHMKHKEPLSVELRYLESIKIWLRSGCTCGVGLLRISKWGLDPCDDWLAPLRRSAPIVGGLRGLRCMFACRGLCSSRARRTVQRLSSTCTLRQQIDASPLNQRRNDQRLCALQHKFHPPHLGKGVSCGKVKFDDMVRPN